MFSYNGGDLPRLSNYAAALGFYEQAKTWRGDSSGGRKLDGSKRHTTIRKDSGGSIACRLHRTDVITYHPDNTITVVPWGSRSTDEFFNSLARATRMTSYFTSGVIRVGDRYYRAIDKMRLGLDPLEMLTEPEPFRFATINRKRAKEMCDQYNYNDFAAYVRMAEKMGVTPLPLTEQRNVYSPRAKLDTLAVRELWPHLLVQGWQSSIYRDAAMLASLTLSTMRDAIYSEHPEVYDRTEEPYLNSWDEVAKWKRQ